MMVTLSAQGSFSAPGLKFMLCYLSVSLRPCQVHVGSCSVCTVSLCAAQLSPCLISPPSFPFHSGSIFQSSPFKVCLCSLPCVKVPCPPYHSSPLAHSHPCFPFSIHLVFPSASLDCPLLLLCLCTPFSVAIQSSAVCSVLCEDALLEAGPK